MANIKDHISSKIVKALVIGDTGSGKSSLLATLANSGYKVVIWDFDNGLDILRSRLTPAGQDNVFYETLRDDMNNAVAFQRGISLLEHWKTTTEDLGKPKDWGNDHVIVIDSLTFMGTAALRTALKRANLKPTDQPTQPVWGDAARWVEQAISFITSDSIKANVIVNTHMRYVEDNSGGRKTYPTAIGSTLPTVLGRYFNTVLRADIKKTKDGETRVLRTQSDFKTDLKTTVEDIPVEVEFDLAKLFDTLRK